MEVAPPHLHGVMKAQLPYPSKTMPSSVHMAPFTPVAVRDVEEFVSSTGTSMLQPLRSHMWEGSGASAAPKKANRARTTRMKVVVNLEWEVTDGW